MPSNPDTTKLKGQKMEHPRYGIVIVSSEPEPSADGRMSCWATPVNKDWPMQPYAVLVDDLKEVPHAD